MLLTILLYCQYPEETQSIEEESSTLLEPLATLLDNHAEFYCHDFKLRFQKLQTFWPEVVNKK